MTNKHYRVGYTLERDVKKELESQGYTVFRSAGSHSMADLIAIEYHEYADECIPGTRVKLVQCKRHKNLMTNKETMNFAKFASDLGADALIAYRDKGIHLESLFVKGVASS